MLSISVYNNAIKEVWTYLILNTLPLFILGIALIVISLIGLFKHLLKKVYLLLLILLSVVILSYSIVEISIFNYDIKHENFVVYYGEFDYMQVSGNSKDVFNFPNNRNLYVRSVADLNITTGMHSGYILYGKTSRWAIAYSNIPFE